LLRKNLVRNVVLVIGLKGRYEGDAKHFITVNARQLGYRNIKQIDHTNILQEDYHPSS
jgi:hypothetical protein